MSTPEPPLRLHERLAADTIPLHESPVGKVLLHRNASIPWLILVPAGEHEQLHELPAGQREAVSQLLDRLASFVVEHLGAARVNVAAIGNLVPQLHVHVVGRSPGDPAWPGVVWGAELPDVSWGEEQVYGLREALASALA